MLLHEPFFTSHFADPLSKVLKYSWFMLHFSISIFTKSVQSPFNWFFFCVLQTHVSETHDLFSCEFLLRSSTFDLRSQSLQVWPQILDIKTLLGFLHVLTKETSLGSYQPVLVLPYVFELFHARILNYKRFRSGTLLLWELNQLRFFFFKRKFIQSNLFRE